MRNKVEKTIVHALLRKVTEYGFEIVKEDYTSEFNHTVKFEKRDEESVFGIVIRFIIPNYLKLQVQFTAYNDLINDFYLTTCKLEEGWYPLTVINFDMDDFDSKLNGKEKFGFYVTDDWGYKGVDAVETAGKIYERYFNYAENQLIPKLNNAYKLNRIINDSRNFEGDNIRLIDYCYPIQNQILSGVALALMMNMGNLDFIISKYLTFCMKDFKKGEDIDIDKLVAFLKMQHPSL